MTMTANLSEKLFLDSIVFGGVIGVNGISFGGLDGFISFGGLDGFDGCAISIGGIVESGTVNGNTCAISIGVNGIFGGLDGFDGCAISFGLDGVVGGNSAISFGLDGIVGGNSAISFGNGFGGTL